MRHPNYKFKTHAIKAWTDDTGYTWGHTLCGIDFEDMSEDLQESYDNFVDTLDTELITCKHCLKKAKYEISQEAYFVR